ncbi:MAG: heavy metal-binding protein [Gammaproteobacteria bacterium]|nr:MAG: heavy metal-binding protein [Gammaproteobacteria bacterium]
MITLTISGMTCGHCEAAVEKALAQVPGVVNVVSVDRNAGQAMVEGTASAEDLVKAVADEGYEVEVAA